MAKAVDKKDKYNLLYSGDNNNNEKHSPARSVPLKFKYLPPPHLPFPSTES